MDGPSSGFEVGCKLKLKTTLGEQLEGEVLAFDASTNCVILHLNSRGPKRNIRFIKADRIEEFSVLGKTEEVVSLPLPYVDLAVLHAKEDAAVRKAEGEAERIGVGVTAEAQDIFFALCKTLPCKWDKTRIIVMDEVQVPNPYRPENVTGGSPEANERVRKVLARERERLQSRLQQST